MHINYYACIYAVHDANGWTPGVIPLPLCFNLWKPLISAVALFSLILKPWGSLGSEAGVKVWLTSNIILIGGKKITVENKLMMQILRTSQLLSICWIIKRYIPKKINYISQEKRRDIFVFAFPILGFLTLCQRGGIHAQAQDSAGGSDTLLAMENSKWCKPKCVHRQAQPQTYPLANNF